MENGDGWSIKTPALQNLESKRKNGISPTTFAQAPQAPPTPFPRHFFSNIYKCCRGDAAVRQSMTTSHPTPPPLTSAVVCCYAALWRRQNMNEEAQRA